MTYRRSYEGLLRAAPITVPCLVVVALFGALLVAEVGYEITSWAPAALLVLGLLGVAVATVPNPWGDVPVPVRVAVGAMAAFTAWSFLSITWSDDRGAALESANRTMLYLAILALFALWQQRERTAAIVVGAWTAVMAVGAAVVLVQVGSGPPQALELFFDGRIRSPSGYFNASAATWLMALWPAVALAASPRVPWTLRGFFAAGAVLLLPLALLSESRGSLISVPVTAVVFLVVLPGRVRHLGILGIVALAAAPAIPAALDVGDALGRQDGDPGDPMGRVLLLSIAGAFVAGAVVTALARLESLRRLRDAQVDRLRTAGRWTASGIVGAVVVAALVVAGNPVDRLDRGWETFKGGYEANAVDGGSRLTSGLGSNRYDFYRVALDEFRASPVIGEGGQSFRHAYLRDGESTETPRYVHSLPLRVLSELGLVGALLLGLVFGGVAWAGVQVLRAGTRLERTVVAAASGAVVYWFVHGSADWLWEFAGLGGPAFALMGLVCSLAPRPDPPRAARLRARGAGEISAVVAVVGLLCAVQFGPWAAAREIDSAAGVFATRPLESYTRLDRAEKLDPLSDRASLLEGSIALRYGDLDRAQEAFGQALGRVPDGQYATLQLGAIASVRGDRPRALRLLRRAVALAPRDALAIEALEVVQGGGTLDIPSLTRAILESAQEFS